MKRLTLATLLLLASSPALAAYKIDFEAQINADRPHSGSIVLNNGQQGSVSFDGTTITLIATESESGSVEINAQIFKKTGAMLSLLSAPKVITRLNMSAQITTSSGPGKGVRLKVTPHQAP